MQTTNCNEQECTRHECTQELAYQLWEQAGCPESDGVEFWLQAEAQLSKTVADIPCTKSKTTLKEKAA